MFAKVKRDWPIAKSIKEICPTSRGVFRPCLGIPLNENEKNIGFLVSWFHGFLFSWFLGFLVSWFPGFLVAWLLGSNVTKFQHFKMNLMFVWKILIPSYPKCISCFQEDIDPIFKIFIESIVDGSSGLIGPRLFQNVHTCRSPKF